MNRNTMFGPTHAGIDDDIAAAGIPGYAARGLAEATAALGRNDREEARQALNRVKYAIAKDEARMMPTPDRLVQTGMVQVSMLSDAQELIEAGVDQPALEYIGRVMAEVQSWG